MYTIDTSLCFAYVYHRILRLSSIKDSAGSKARIKIPYNCAHRAYTHTYTHFLLD